MTIWNTPIQSLPTETLILFNTTSALNQPTIRSAFLDFFLVNIFSQMPHITPWQIYATYNTMAGSLITSPPTSWLDELNQVRIVGETAASAPGCVEGGQGWKIADIYTSAWLGLPVPESRGKESLKIVA